MPPRKSLDIDADLAAIQARADKLRVDQKLALGELVLETGVHKLLDADQIRDALLRARDQAKATPSPQNEACEVPYRYVLEGADRGDVENLMGLIEVGFQHKLLAALSAPRGTSVVVVSSPAYAFRMAATLYAIAGDGAAMRWLIPAIAEPGSDVPVGLRGLSVRPGPDHGKALLSDDIEVVQVPLRSTAGELVDDSEIAETFERHRNASTKRTITCMSFGDATGVAGPVAGRISMMDATQMRVRASRIGDHLKRGHPIVISGSTFLGGPLHSGALLLPPGAFTDEVRQEAMRLWREDCALNWRSDRGFSRGFANMLRWMPGLLALETIAALGPKADVCLAQMTMEMTALLQEFPDFFAFEGRSSHQAAICGQDSGVVSFAIKNGSRGWMAMPEMTALCHKLAEQHVLLGLPIVVGQRAALRLSVGAGDVCVGSIGHKLGRVADALRAVGFGRRASIRPARAAGRQAAQRAAGADAVCWQ